MRNVCRMTVFAALATCLTAQTDDWSSAPTVGVGVYYVDSDFLTSSFVPGRCFTTTRDAWIRFVPVTNGWLRITTNPCEGGGALTDQSRVEIFAETPGGPTPIVCGQDSFCSSFVCCPCYEDHCCSVCTPTYSRAFYPVSAGVPLLLSFGSEGGYVSAAVALTAPASNDAPSGATPVVDGLGQMAVVRDTVAETNPASCPLPNRRDVWFTYTASVTGHVAVSTLADEDLAGTTDGRSQKSHVAIWDAAGIVAGTPIECGVLQGGWGGLAAEANRLAARADAAIVVGRTYYFQISLFGGWIGEIKFDVESSAGPEIPFRPAVPSWAPVGPADPWYLRTARRTSFADATVAAAQAGGMLLELAAGPEFPGLPGDFALAPYWLGLVRNPATGLFSSWMSGAPVTYQNWAAGEPSSSSGMDHVVVDFADGLWRTVPAAAVHLALIEIPETRVARVTSHGLAGSACPNDQSWYVWMANGPRLGSRFGWFLVSHDPATSFDALAYVFAGPAAATGGYPLGGPCFSALDPGAAILVGSYFRPAFTYESYFPVTTPRIDALAGVAWRLQVLELPIGGGFRVGEAVEFVFGY